MMLHLLGEAGEASVDNLVGILWNFGLVCMAWRLIGTKVGCIGLGFRWSTGVGWRGINGNGLLMDICSSYSVLLLA